MSEESPPTYTTRIFNQANFGTTSGIDTAYLNAHYLRYPTAQTGTETIANLATTNDATINTISVGKGSTDTSTNVVLGYQSLTSIADNGGDPYNALQNIAVGYQSLPALTTGYRNIAIGGQALNKLTVLFNNIAIGFQAGYNAVGGENVAIGVGALYGSAITTSNGNYNTAVGSSALSTNTTGSNNTALGYQAGQAGTANTTGSNNTCVGYQAQANANNYSNSTALGKGATITASNMIMLGTSTEKVYIGGNSSYPLPYIVASGSQVLTATAGTGRVALSGTFTVPSGYDALVAFVSNGDANANNFNLTLTAATTAPPGTVYVIFNNANAGAFRVNYVIYGIKV